MPAQPHFNIEKFKNKVQEYAAMLVMMMSKETENTHEIKQELSPEAALSFIQSLSVKGGDKVPADINPMECLVEDKYER